MKTYYVLSGNQVLGHFDTLNESWTLEEGVDCVFVDDESGAYVFNVEGCRVLDFEPNAGVLELCERIRNSCEWDPVDTCILCEFAGLNAEWLNATGEDFERVVYEAAEKLGVLSYEYCCNY